MKITGRPHFVLRWEEVDPETGSIVPRQEKTSVTGRREAERLAAAREQELSAVGAGKDCAWPEFLERHAAERLPTLKPKTAEAWETVVSHITTFRSPRTVSAVTADYVSQLAGWLRTQKRLDGSRRCGETSIGAYLGHLKAALSWAKGLGMIPAVPEITLPRRRRRARGPMRGRPLTGEELDRFKAKVGKVVGQERAAGWLRLIDGLWLSGLRLSEALDFWWDRGDRLHVVDLQARRPMLRFHESQEKGGQNRLLPITPDFATFLRAIPDSERSGKVFPVVTASRTPVKARRASRILSNIGSLAKIVTDIDPETGRVIHATAHDFRRSFGDRWAPRVSAAILKDLMRHRSIETTLRFYVGQSAERAAAEVWASITGDKTGDKPVSDQIANERK